MYNCITAIPHITPVIKRRGFVESQIYKRCNNQSNNITSHNKKSTQIGSDKQKNNSNPDK